MRPITMGIGLVLFLTGMLPALAQESDGTAEVAALYKEAKELKAAGKSKEAAEVYEKVVAKAQIALGMDHVNTAMFMHILADLYKSMAQYEKAEPLYQSSLKIYKEKLGKDHRYVALSLNNLANLYEGIGQFAKAEPL